MITRQELSDVSLAGRSDRGEKKQVEPAQPRQKAELDLAVPRHLDAGPPPIVGREHDRRDGIPEVAEHLRHSFNAAVLADACRRQHGAPPFAGRCPDLASPPSLTMT